MIRETCGTWIRYHSNLLSYDFTPCTFSAVPQTCDYGCSCYYDSSIELNIFNCSSRNLTQLPPVFPESTNWLDLSRNRIHTLCKMFSNFQNIQYVDLSYNVISNVEYSFIDAVKNMNISYLNLETNEITKLPETIRDLTSLKELRLSGNPFGCDCDMLWMQRWLYKLSTSSDENFISDYKDVKCGSELMFGIPVFKLEGDAMGCTLEWYWIVVLACVSVSIFVVAALVLHRNWEKLKFLLFVHFDILTTDDGKS